MYMLDTNILIDFLRGRSQLVYEKLRESNARLFELPTIVKAELLLGAEKAADSEQERRKVETLLLPYKTVPFDDECAYQYARIRAFLENKGLTIGANDYVIAATALARSAILVTNNTKEFKRIPGLAIEVWSELRHDGSSPSAPEGSET